MAMYDEVRDVRRRHCFSAEYLVIVRATRGSTCICYLLWLSAQWLMFLCRCVPNQHLCGKACKFSGRCECQDICAKVCTFARGVGLTSDEEKVVGHIDEEHLCAALFMPVGG